MSWACFRFPDLEWFLTLRKPLHCKDTTFPKLFSPPEKHTNVSGFGITTGKLESLHSPQLHCFRNLEKIGRMREEKEMKEGVLLCLECNDNASPPTKSMKSTLFFQYGQNILYKTRTGFMQCLCYLCLDTWFQLRTGIAYY